MKKSNKMVGSTEKKVEKKEIQKRNFYFPEIWKTIIAEDKEKATEIARKW